MFEIFQYDFMIRALAAGIIISIVAPLIGIFLVVRRLSLIADTLAHVSLVGIAGGMLAGINPIAGALAASLLAGVGIEKLRSSKKGLADSALALFLSASLAIAGILLSLSKGQAANISSFLFGSITTVQKFDIVLIGTLGVFTIAIVALFYKEFFAISFDEDLAEAHGIRVRFLNMLLVILGAVTVALSLRIVGILLINALIVIPVISAMQLGKSFKKTLVLSILFSFFSLVIGLFLSFYLDLASGGAIVLVALAFFGVSLLLGRK